jgi:hypothetical protein
MVNPKSLENLKLPKVRKEGHGYRYSLPQDKIDALFTNMAEGMSLKKAAKECGICFETARKYFRQGDEKRGIKPLQWRLTIFQDKISEKFNVLLEERRMEMLETVRSTLTHIKGSIEAKICKCCSGEGVQSGNDGIKIQCPVCKGEGKLISALMSKSSLKDLERLMRLEVFLLGGVMQKEHEKKFLSAEDCSGDNQEGTESRLA